MAYFTFFYDNRIPQVYLNRYSREGFEVSIKFLECADYQLRIAFEKQTGIKMNINTCFCPPLKLTLNYVSAEVSEACYNFFVSHNYFHVKIKWKSKSGRIYKFEDEDIDCDDVEFWFDDLDATLVHKYLYLKVTLPFKLKDLTYNLVVTRINMECNLEMVLKENLEHELVTKQIDDFIADFNHKSEKKVRKDGVVHNWKIEFINDKLIYELDLGSTGVSFIKKLLTFLNKLNTFETVELC
jgi:hypothetical protein